MKVRQRALRSLAICAVAVSLGSSGCVTWHSTPVDHLTSIPAPARVRVSTPSLTRYQMSSGVIVSDSLFEVERSCQTEVAAGGQIVCSESRTFVTTVRDITLLEIPQMSWGRTLAIGAAGAVATLVVLFLYDCFMEAPSFEQCGPT